jgi:cytoskeleton protein RodZ
MPEPTDVEPARTRPDPELSGSSESSGVSGSSGSSGADDNVVAGTPVVVRRNAGLAALVGAGASAIAIAYLWRASASVAPLDWALCLVMAAIAAVYLGHLVDARTPLLVADDLGVRIRLGNQWRGLPWDAVDRIVVQPRRGPVKDGRLMFAPHSMSRALDGLDARGRRSARLNQRLYGAALAVPMGLTTRLSVPGQELAASLAALADGRADVVVVPPKPRSETPAGGSEPSSPTVQPTVQPPAEPVVEPVPERAAVEPLGDPAGDPVGDPGEPEPVPVAVPDGPLRRSALGGLATIVSRVAKGRSHDVDTVEEPDDPDDLGSLDADADADRDVPPPRPATAARSAVPLRDVRPGSRAQITRDAPATVLGNAARHPDRYDEDGRRRAPLPEGRELRRPGSVELEFESAPSASDFESGRVRPISSLGDPVDALVIDDFVTEPAYDPVIGPELAAARVRVGLSVDELADRTRIRPHVIESVEVDDFAPCGGDFYARGHLRTLARVLGKDPAPLLAQFDERYATAPINARRVFEAELATGMTGSMRSTVGGPNWALLVGVVLVLVMVWGAVRLFASEPTELLRAPVPVLNGSAGVGSGRVDPGAAAQPVPVGRPIRLTLVGAQDGSKVVVRNGSGKVVWAGMIVLGEKRTVRALPPLTVRATDAGALEARVNGVDKGSLGSLGAPGRRTFHRPPPR